VCCLTTSQLYRVAHGNDAVLFRVYGAKTEVIIDRELENKIAAYLTQRGFGARVFGGVRNGRVEEWLSGSSLKPNDMLRGDLMPKIGAKLAEMHALDMPVSRNPSVWLTMEKWLEVALTVSFDEPERQAAYKALDLPTIKREIMALKAKLMLVDSPVVFSHNDLLSGNIMYDADTDKVTLIDYEYSAYNYRGFDIGNHFCECCGFDCDWSQFPDKQKQFTFLRGYLSHALKVPQDQVPESALNDLYYEVGPWALAPHLFWGIWAVVQARFSPIDFDFLNYAKLRLGGFFQMKADALKMVRK